ncbi:ATP-binding protein [Thioalkalivibrio sp. HK1]|uniref:ATP-binding protein n=1 Tax=Thioalkalivibrio sp. HK1 TaxID=1469245 RepID=UPI0012DCDCA1|nr:ATP-binding protein [Thioalkalivibrio sp. HK1]
MGWTDTHGALLAKAFEEVLATDDADSKSLENGTMAFVRCLDSEVIEKAASSSEFLVGGWKVYRVADRTDDARRTITADRAVEIREDKSDPALLLVDTDLAGAGMDGIYSAAREIDEETLFGKAKGIAIAKIKKERLNRVSDFASRACTEARRRSGVSPWSEFDFLCGVLDSGRPPGERLHSIGLWPIDASQNVSEEQDKNDLILSRKLADRFFSATSRYSIDEEFEALGLRPSNEQKEKLHEILNRSKAVSPLEMMAEIGDDLRIGKIEAVDPENVESINMTSWIAKNGRPFPWSGLKQKEDDEVPSLIIDPNAKESGKYSKLTVKWKVKPEGIRKNDIFYRIVVMAGDEEITEPVDQPHSGKGEEKIIFTNDSFTSLDDDFSISSAKVLISVVNKEEVSAESEIFAIVSGETEEEEEKESTGKRVRTFSEGAIDLDDRGNIAIPAKSLDKSKGGRIDPKDFLALTFKENNRNKNYRVFYPPLIQEVERQWVAGNGALGRWTIRVRESGDWAKEKDALEFKPMEGFARIDKSHHERLMTAGAKMSRLFGLCGGPGQIYDEKNSEIFETVSGYLKAWSDAFSKNDDPNLTLCHTVEVQPLSGEKSIGLIVLPSHPLRVAWHVAYDNLLLHAAFEESKGGPPAKDLLKEFEGLDGAMFPAFLPNPNAEGGAFVFADTLGFHAVGMVPESNKEPKASIAILARALGGAGAENASPTTGDKSAKILGNEILKYIECHDIRRDDIPRQIRIHAMRAGAGLTVARALGEVFQEEEARDKKMRGDEEAESGPLFLLEFYPSKEQRSVAGRFIAEATEKRRRGAGTLEARDRWMLDSVRLHGDINMPRLRWAKRNHEVPDQAAHLAIAFDTFDSNVVSVDGEGRSSPAPAPFYAFGLLSFFDREYENSPMPVWHSVVRPAGKGERQGEKHPSKRAHSERLNRLQQAIYQATARHIGAKAKDPWPVLKTGISDEKERSLKNIHRRCDWVITLDRNAGVEYFDSPRDNRDVYDTYVIDCVPERDDLGCLQLVTSTGNLEEMHDILARALGDMGLDHSARNTKFLMQSLKALSGRLVIRLTGNIQAQISEIVALAFSHALCNNRSKDDECSLPLDQGFFIPVDDVLDILPPLQEGGERIKGIRPDLIYVSVSPRRGLRFQFIEVKYRSNLYSARDPDLLERIEKQIGTLRDRWEKGYFEEKRQSIRSIRRAKLARVLHFYAKKAQRHCLSDEKYKEITAEIDKMIEKGGDYSFSNSQDKEPKDDRGWVFCPEYSSKKPTKISLDDGDTSIYLFGPADLLDSMPRRRPDTNDHSPEPTQDPTSPSIRFGKDRHTGADVDWSVTIKGNPHLLIGGLPGMGKTTCLLNLCKQMSAKGIVPIIFSFHQDIDEKLVEEIDSTRFVDFDGLDFNPLQVMDRAHRNAHLDAAGAIRDIFLAIFPGLGSIQAGRIREAVKQSFIEKGWGKGDISDEMQTPKFGRFVEILRQEPKPDQGLRNLLTRLDELEDYGFFKTREVKSSLWDSDKPIVIRVHRTQNDNLQRAFASLVFYGLYKDMFQRGLQDRITHALIFDEAHRAAGLKLIPTMAKECRKYGISLVLASQEAKDFDPSVFSAIANYLVLRLNEADAKSLVRNVAGSQQERDLMDRIKQMERFEAFYFQEGRRKPNLVGLSS